MVLGGPSGGNLGASSPFSPPGPLLVPCHPPPQDDAPWLPWADGQVSINPTASAHQSCDCLEVGTRPYASLWLRGGQPREWGQGLSIPSPNPPGQVLSCLREVRSPCSESVSSLLAAPCQISP